MDTVPYRKSVKSAQHIILHTIRMNNTIFYMIDGEILNIFFYIIHTLSTHKLLLIKFSNHSEKCFPFRRLLASIISPHFFTKLILIYENNYEYAILTYISF